MADRTPAQRIGRGDDDHALAEEVVIQTEKAGCVSKRAISEHIADLVQVTWCR
jgi:hypothetical protein